MTIRLALTAVPVALTTLVFAQAPQDRGAAIKEALARNQAALKQYSWIETTTITHKGEVKKQEQKQCYYGADGKVQKTPLPGQAAAPQQQPQGRGRRGGLIKEAIVEHKVDEMKDYLEKAAALVHEYVPPDPARIKTAESGGNLSIQPGPSATTLSIKNYLKQGDSLSIGFDPAAKALRTYTATSYVEKPKDDDLTLAVTFAQL